jgi:hypothetical protein
MDVILNIAADLVLEFFSSMKDTTSRTEQFQTEFLINYMNDVK